MALLPDSTWTVVIPVKSLSSAKSRIGAESSATLALAFFRDTLTAVVACPDVGSVVVTTHDEVIAGIARHHGSIVVDDTDHPGINAAAAWAAELSAASRPVAVVVSDLPCLTSAALSAVLAAALTSGTSFLADADGTGTTMWMTNGTHPVDLHFGPSSAEAHRGSHAVDLVDRLDADVAPARRDVDTAANLQDAIRLGVGRHTRHAVGVGTPALVTALGRTSDGRLHLADEDGGRHSVEESAIVASGLRTVRPGQRLVLDETSVPILRIP